MSKFNWEKEIQKEEKDSFEEKKHHPKKTIKEHHGKKKEKPFKRKDKWDNIE